MPRPRSTYTAEFKLSAVKMITAQKLSVAEAARRLDVGENLLREWRKAFLAKGDAAFPGHGNPAPADNELQRLRAENARLRAERDLGLRADDEEPAACEERRETEQIHPVRSVSVQRDDCREWSLDAGLPDRVDQTHRPLRSCAPSIASRPLPSSPASAEVVVSGGSVRGAEDARDGAGRGAAWLSTSPGWVARRFD